MKLASINNHSRDGQLVVVNKQGRGGQLVVVIKQGTRAVQVPQVAQTLQQAMDNWELVVTQLNTIYQHLNEEGVNDAFDLDMNLIMAPLPRGLQFLDGSAS